MLDEALSVEVCIALPRKAARQLGGSEERTVQMPCGSVVL